MSAVTNNKSITSKFTFPYDANKLHTILNTCWDFVVIGSGIGGATFGYRMAEKGYRVLFVEKGQSADIKNQYPEQVKDFAKNPLSLLKRANREWQTLDDINLTSPQKSKHFIPYIGSGIGGSSKLYGMVFERFSPSEFTNPLAPWPVSAETMQTYYDRAAQMYHLKTKNIQSEANLEIIHKLKQAGIETYSLTKAQLDGNCSGCQGHVCTCNQKVDAETACIQPAIKNWGAEIITGCEVIQINTQTDESSVESISVKIDCIPDQIFKIFSKNFALAAGALASPSLLLKSNTQKKPEGIANSSGQVGKNMMRHLIDIYGLWTWKKPESQIDIKEFGAKDLIFDTDENRHKGLLQSFGRFPHIKTVLHEISTNIQNPIVKYAFHCVAPVMGLVLNYLFRRMIFVATILEDSPTDTNQVFQPTPKGKIQFHYQVSDKDEKQLLKLRKLMQQKLNSFFSIKLYQAHSNDRIAHVCGTCRMGTNPQTSVVDANGRTHDLPNLWIVDASVFPSSGSGNPSFTIAANALRCADLVADKSNYMASSSTKVATNTFAAP